MNMKEFWTGQAKKFKHDVEAVNFDPLGDDLEIDQLEKLIKDGDTVCDLGCGNGRALLEIAGTKKHCKLYGVDFVREMIDLANEKKSSLNVENVSFYQFDAVSKELPDLFNFKFDKVITKRLLINVKGSNKHQAVKNVHEMLKDRGTYIMVECFLEPLEKINKIRKKMNLDAIKVKEFNEYLSQIFFQEISGLFTVKKKIDFQSLYYFISRVFNARLAEGKPDYFSPINLLSADLIKQGINPIKGYAPEVIYLLNKTI